MRSFHQLHERRSLRLHRWVVCDDFGIWEKILRSVPHRLPEILCGSGEEVVRLRQSSPFAGLIPEEIRHQILATTE